MVTPRLGRVSVLVKSELNSYCGFVDIPSPSFSKQMRQDEAMCGGEI